MVDLYCNEILDQADPEMVDYATSHMVMNNKPTVTKAEVDQSLIDDHRVFRNMIDTEDFYVSDNNYFENVQKEIKLPMRKLVTDWMLEVRTLLCLK